MIRLAVAGATGRMGRCVLERASQDQRFAITAALTASGDTTVGSPVRVGDGDVTITDSLEGECDVLIDFTVAAGTMAWISVCERRAMPLVIGATGHDDRQLARIREASRVIPIVKATNFSVGIYAILGFIGKLVSDLGEDYDVEIIETHHHHKVDAPSGTALTLVDRIAAARGATLANVVFGRHGQVGERPAGQIGVHAVRLGETVGQHEIQLSGLGETVSIRHTAHSRSTFAAGALRAAAWVVGKKAGLYSMEDVLA